MRFSILAPLTACFGVDLVTFMQREAAYKVMMLSSHHPASPPPFTLCRREHVSDCRTNPDHDLATEWSG